MMRRSRQRSTPGWAGPLTLILALSMAGAGYAVVRDRLDQRESPDDYGRPVPASAVRALDDPADAPAVAVRAGCAIQRFGVAPWLVPGKPRDAEWAAGTRAALVRMGLPHDAAVKAVDILRSGQPNDTIGMGNAGGLATRSGQPYSRAFSTTFQHDGQRVVCHGTKVAFANPNRHEYARLFLIEHQGATYHVAEFLACNNVTRLIPSADPGADRERLQAVRANAVDEPGTVWLMVLAAAGMLAARRWLS